MSDKEKTGIDDGLGNGSVEGSVDEIEANGFTTLSDEKDIENGGIDNGTNGAAKGSGNDLEAPAPAPAPAPPMPAANAVPNGGLTAWLQVVGSFFLMMNCW